MARLIFDIETDGLLPELTKIHCISVIDADTGQQWNYGPNDIYSAIIQLEKADELIGHNVIGFDIPALDKITAFTMLVEAKVTDTLILSQLMHTNLAEEDSKRRKKDDSYPGAMVGKHSLEAWGYRLGLHKDTDFDAGDWSTYTPEMLEYCAQDTRVSFALWRYLTSDDYSRDAIALEHSVKRLCCKITDNGFPFDREKADALYQELFGLQANLTQQLKGVFGDWSEPGEIMIPKRDNRTLGYVKGQEFQKVKRKSFNPSSRQHIGRCLIEKYGWQPTEFTPTGQPKISEETLENLDFPEAKLLHEYLVIDKRLGQLAEGANGWLRLARQGPKLSSGARGCGEFRIHGEYIPNGTVTGRATHFRPNISQVPSIDKPYGKECRSLFVAGRPDWVIVGSDLSGIELRCLGHYMAHWDNGEYIRELLDGDIHTKTQNAVGLTERRSAKTLSYAFLYGAGDARLGSIVESSAGRRMARGKQMRAKLLKAFPALAKLQAAVVSKAKDPGFLTGLDGRRLHVRSAHSALNTLLQSAGALIAKEWILEIERQLQSRGLVHGWTGDYAMCAWIHDEVQIACKQEYAEDVGRICTEAAARAGEHFKFKCPIEAEYSVGRSWADTH